MNFKHLLLISLLPLSSLAASDSVKVKCEFNLEGNKVRSKDAKEFDLIKALKTDSFTEEFVLTGGTGKRIEVGFKRIAPYAEDKLKHKDYNVVLFKRTEVKMPLGVPYKQLEFKSGVHFMINNDNIFGGDTVDMNYRLVAKSGDKSKNIAEGSFTLVDEKTISGKLPYEFGFTQYEYTGFLGITGFFKDEVEGKKDSRVVDVSFECKISRPEVDAIEDGDREEEVIENHVDEFSGLPMQTGTEVLVD